MRMDLVTFGGWHDGTWTLRGDPKPMAEELLMLSGEPEAYRSFVSGYFEIEVPVEPVAHLLAGKKLSAKLLSALGSERTLAEMKDDLAEIGYGT